MLFDTVLAFDHVQHRLLLIANARITADDDLEALYQFACARDPVPGSGARAQPVDGAHGAGGAVDAAASNLTKEAFEAIVRTAKEHIAAGDIYQVVLSQRFEADVGADPFTVYRALRHVNPSPVHVLHAPRRAARSSARRRRCWCASKAAASRRIRLPARARAAQRRRGHAAGRGAEAQREGARRARHAGRSRPQRRRPRLRVRHGARADSSWRSSATRTSCTWCRSSRARSPTDARSARRARRRAFPAGTVSGAPKVRAMEIIAELEPTRRGIYAGAVGYLDFAGNLDFCITIRTVVIDGRQGLRAGRRRHRRRLEPGGRVRGDARQGAGGGAGAGAGAAGTRAVGRTRWCFVLDNYDSFTYNLVQYLGRARARGCAVRRNDQVTLDEIEALAPVAHRHLARPGTAGGRGRDGRRRSAVRAARPDRSACASGIRRSGMVYGGRVVRAPVPMHGKTSVDRARRPRRVRRA